MMSEGETGIEDIISSYNCVKILSLILLYGCDSVINTITLCYLSYVLFCTFEIQ